MMLMSDPNRPRDKTFFRDYILARETIRQKRLAGEPGPWSDDPVFQNNRFCNVYREDDRTTVWFRENVRRMVSVYGLGDSVINNRLHHLRAAMLFRWFNRIETGQLLFDGPAAPGWRLVFGKGSAVIREAIGAAENLLESELIKKGLPVITGSYCILSAPGMPKLQGVLSFVEAAWHSGVLEEIAGSPVRSNMSLETLWKKLKAIHGLGGFMAYEIVTDMRHTPQFSSAPDILFWANPGPGAIRGLAKLFRGYTGGREITAEHKVTAAQTQTEMQELLAYISSELGDHPYFKRGFEMRDVEHTCCEVDKFTRVLDGQGKPRGTFSVTVAKPTTGLT
jgi:hypothetical protein